LGLGQYPPGDGLDPLFGEHGCVGVAHCLPQQTPHERRGGDLRGGGPLPELGVEFSVDPQVQRDVQRRGRLSGLGLGRLGFFIGVFPL